MSWCSHSSTCIIHLLLTFHPLLLTVFFSFQGLNPDKIDCPHLLTLHAFSYLGLVASVRVRCLMELSSANHAHSSHQASGDLNWMNLVPPRGYLGGNGKKNRSHSQMSIQHANNKNKLVDFAVVSGWTALAGRWCSASWACFSTELQVYLNGQWRELFELQVMMCHGLIAPLFAPE
jgi:hypothetical protein